MTRKLDDLANEILDFTEVKSLTEDIDKLLIKNVSQRESINFDLVDTLDERYDRAFEALFSSLMANKDTLDNDVYDSSYDDIQDRKNLAYEKINELYSNYRVSWQHTYWHLIYQKNGYSQNE